MITGRQSARSPKSLRPWGSTMLFIRRAIQIERLLRYSLARVARNLIFEAV